MPSSTDLSWRPSANLATLRAQADLRRTIRQFFDARQVLEVDTPLLSRHATVDVHIESFRSADRWLHTSPEFAMKRLLCAGSGDIWQLCKVFRREEAGRHHNPEFTLLEWYRTGFDHHRLMDEVESLLRVCGLHALPAFPRLRYREAFVQHAGFDPEGMDAAALQARTRAAGLPIPASLTVAECADATTWLDLWMSFAIAPHLGSPVPCFLTDFPAAQAALARVHEGVAQRFELFWRGVELANGFYELADAAEQQRRFQRDADGRLARDGHTPPFDAAMIAALTQGLPDCAGVALGFDRLLMLLRNAPDIASVLAFDWERA